MQSSVRQKRLRLACQNGNLSEVKALLSEEKQGWRQALSSPWSAGSWLLKCCRLGSRSTDPARLDYIYDGDNANLPVHYIASGSPPSLVQRMLGAITGQEVIATANAKERAELLDWLLREGPVPFNLGSVNGSLETPLHCALRSCSLEVLEVLLLSICRDARTAREIVACRDLRDEQPLDIAIATQQWPAVRLLVQAGALEGYPPLLEARAQLELVLPARQLPGMARYSGLAASLPFGLGRMFGLGASASAAPSKQTSSQMAQQQRLNMADSTRVLGNRNAVLAVKKESVERLARLLNVKKAAAVLLLMQHRWQEEAAAEAYTANPIGALNEAGISASMPAARETPPLACNVCYEMLQPGIACVSLQCGHATCDVCWKGILKTKLDDGEAHRVTCPEPECSILLPDTDAERLLSTADLRRYRRMQAQHYVDSNPSLKWCQRPGCEKAISIDSLAGVVDGALEAAAGSRALNVQCSCGHRFCFSCLAPPHEPSSCHAAKEWARVMREVQALEESHDESWVERNSKPCKGCGARIQKNGGCNHMICSKCRHQFCWVCGEDWAMHNSATESGEAGEETVAPNEAPWGILGQLIGKIQDVAVNYRLSYFLRRYQACDCDARQLRTAAGWMEVLLLISLPAGIPQETPVTPANSIAVSQTGSAPAVQEVELTQVNETTQHLDLDGDHQRAARRPGLGSAQILQSSDPNPAPVHAEPPLNSLSASVDDCSSASSAQAQSKEGTSSSFGYLLTAANEVVQARELLRHSYVAAYFMEWGAHKRFFEETLGQLSGAVEQLMVLLVQMPNVQAVIDAADRQQRWAPDTPHSLMPSPYEDTLPVFLPDRSVLRQQLCFALAMHERSAQVKSFLAAMSRCREQLVLAARRGVIDETLGGASIAEAFVTTKGSVPAPANQGVRDMLNNLSFAISHFWEGQPR